MSLYYRIKRPDGQFDLVEQFPQELAPVPITAPSAAGATSPMARYFCTACTPERPFKGQGVMAMHFNKRHKDLVVSKETWREYIREFGNVKAETKKADVPDTSKPD